MPTRAAWQWDSSHEHMTLLINSVSILPSPFHQFHPVYHRRHHAHRHSYSLESFPEIRDSVEEEMIVCLPICRQDGEVTGLCGIGSLALGLGGEVLDGKCLVTLSPAFFAKLFAASTH
jgi:hypothetical protein